MTSAWRVQELSQEMSFRDSQIVKQSAMVQQPQEEQQDRDQQNDQHYQLLCKVGELTRELVSMQQRLFYYKSAFGSLVKQHQICQKDNQQLSHQLLLAKQEKTQLQTINRRSQRTIQQLTQHNKEIEALLKQQKSIYERDKTSNQKENKKLIMLQQEIQTLQADNSSLRLANQQLQQDMKRLQTIVEQLRYSLQLKTIQNTISTNQTNNQIAYGQLQREINRNYQLLQSTIRHNRELTAANSFLQAQLRLSQGRLVQLQHSTQTQITTMFRTNLTRLKQNQIHNYQSNTPSQYFTISHKQQQQQEQNRMKPLLQPKPQRKNVRFYSVRGQPAIKP